MVRSGTVSVVIPNHNRAPLLRSAIESALAQRGAVLEVLVCDDGSSDDSESIVRSFDDSRVRWLPGDSSGGPSRPRNRGIGAARGEWVAFLDSDDVWLEGKIDAQLDLLETTSSVACTTNAYRCVPGRIGNPPLLLDALPRRLDLKSLLSRNLVVTSSVLVAKTALHRSGGFPEAPERRIFEDYALWLRIAQQGPIEVLADPWVLYRDEASTSLRGSMSVELVCTANSLRDFLRWRRTQRPRIDTSFDERVLMTRQLSRLVAVRDFVRHATKRRRHKSNPSV